LHEFWYSLTLYTPNEDAAVGADILSACYFSPEDISVSQRREGGQGRRFKIHADFVM
jgi:hypothetical protein